ncbi:MAG TPA: S41 family peptidase [Pyrinomonadaceae bacterium]|nr:S41 family peptidase [Pyrinomonadaceae bacterium]
MRRFKATFATVAALAAALFVNALTSYAQPNGGPRQPDMTVDAAARNEVIDSLLKRLNESYVFPDVAKRMEQAVRTRQANKEYDQLSSASAFAQALTSHLQEVSRDKHLRVRFSPEPIPARERRGEPSAEERERQRAYMRRVNYGFERVERLPGNVGYVDFRGFFDPENGAETVAAVMNFLANTDAVIFDLRKNGGGDPHMVALICSYLFGSEPVHLNSLYWREGNRTEEFWTHKTVAGKRYEGKDVYVLTSNYTFSGAEEFAYNLKNLKRATIVGETTGGGAHPGSGVRLAEHFGAFIPTGRAISPVTKTNWEGTGVQPDIAVPADQALKTAHLMAAQKALAKTTDEPLKRALKDLTETLQKELDELKRQPARTPAQGSR